MTSEADHGTLPCVGNCDAIGQASCLAFENLDVNLMRLDAWSAGTVGGLKDHSGVEQD